MLIGWWTFTRSKGHIHQQQHHQAEHLPSFMRSTFALFIFARVIPPGASSGFPSILTTGTPCDSPSGSPSDSTSGFPSIFTRNAPKRTGEKSQSQILRTSMAWLLLGGGGYPRASTCLHGAAHHWWLHFGLGLGLAELLPPNLLEEGLSGGRDGSQWEPREIQGRGELPALNIC